jgi:glutamate dehydrogenase
VNTEVQSSTLWSDPALQRKVLAKALPRTLTDELGLDTVLERLPDDYKKSLFGCYIASRYIYAHGMNGQEFAFFEFMQSWGDDK